MRKLASAVWMVLVPVAATALGACASSPAADGPAGPGAASPRSAETSASSATTEMSSPRDSGPGVGAYAAVVPENIVWIPWKMIGGAFKGAGDGVGAGFAKGRLPALGVLFSPINLVTGFVTGFAEGAVMSPGVIGPSDNFGRTMALPTKRVTSVWWYP